MSVAPVPLRTFDEAEVLAWIQSQGRLKVSAAELGRLWGWHEARVRRHLNGWKSDVVIRCRGRTIYRRRGGGAETDTG